MATRKKTKTPTGASLLEIALRLMRDDPKLTLEDAKYKAKEQVKAKDSVEKKKEGIRASLGYGIGGKTKKKVLSSLFGQRIGGYLSDKIRSKGYEEFLAKKLVSGSEKNSWLSDKIKEYEVHEHSPLIHPEEPKPVKERVQSTTLKAIDKKLTSIDASIKAIKTVKVPEPTHNEPVLKTQAHEDAELGLQALGYKKAEIREMLASAVGTTAQELIKSALKPKNKDKIPAVAVPVAAEKARVEVATMTVPDAAQEEAKETKVSETQHDVIKQDAKWKKDVTEKLDEILKHVKGGHLLDDLMKLLGPIMLFLKPIWDTLKNVGKAIEFLTSKILSVASDIVKAIINGVKNFIKSVPKVLKGIGETLTDAIESGAAELGLAGATDAVVMGATAYMASGKMAQKQVSGIEQKAAEYGMKPVLNKEGFTEAWNINGKIKKPNELTPEEQDVVDYATLADVNPYLSKKAKAKIDANPNAYKNLELSTPSQPMLPEIGVSAQRVDAASTENKEIKSSNDTPVIVQQIDNSKTVVQPTQQSGGDIITVNTKNAEPSVGNYLAGLFNHPVVRLPM